MVAIDNGIYLSGVSGKIWYYNGDYIKGPIFQLEDSNIKLSATCMVSHKFAHETESYLYVGSDVKPRLFRAPLSSAYLGSDWESLYNTGELAASSGGILSLTSAFNKVFIGCRNNKILRYERSQNIRLDQPNDFIPRRRKGCCVVCVRAYVVTVLTRKQLNRRFGYVVQFFVARESHDDCFFKCGHKTPYCCGGAKCALVPGCVSWRCTHGLVPGR